MRFKARTLGAGAGFLAALIWATASGPAQAQEETAQRSIPDEYRWENVITDFDKSRLERADEALALGNEEAAAADGVSYDDRLALKSVMDAKAVPVDDSHLLGWRGCRMIKVGGRFAGLAVYPFFDCRITVVDGFLFFEKRSGSQRMSGRLYQNDALSRILLAAPTYNDAPQRPYMSEADENTDPQIQNAVGLLNQLEDGRLRILFPWPALEASYTVLELRSLDNL